MDRSSEEPRGSGSRWEPPPAADHPTQQLAAAGPTRNAADEAPAARRRRVPTAVAFGIAVVIGGAAGAAFGVMSTDTPAPAADTVSEHGFGEHGPGGFR